MITAINTIRNGIVNGYPLVEAILSVLPLVDEYLVNDGGSTDGTLEVLKRMEKTFPKIRLYQILDRPNVRWDCVSDILNFFIEEARGDWIFLGNMDELLHERDIPQIKRFIEETEWPIIRYQRREITHKWSRLSEEVYHPARTAKKQLGLYQNWNSYGGDEFILPEGWIDPERTLQSPFIIYHLYAVFPQNMINKRRNDAEWLAPGDTHRVAIYERMRGGQCGKVSPPNPDEVYPDLPALARGLSQMSSYVVREELFDSKWLEEKTGLKYHDNRG